MSSIIHQPHDKVFKQSMAEPRVAREFFVAHLPLEILHQADLDTLKLEKHSFIDDNYKATEADVIYSVKLEKNLAYFYLLCENQSKVDPIIAFRLLIYSVRQMELHRKQYPNTPLPVVYPFVVYSGEAIWDAPLEIYELFGEQANLAKAVLLKPYQLIDLQRTSDEDIYQHRWSGLVEFALKYRQVRNFERFLQIFLPWINEIEICGGSNYAKIMLGYSFDSINTDDEKILIQKSTEYLSEELRSEVMTIAQRIKQRGIEEGYEKGIEQGIEQGIKLLAMKLLRKGMPLAEIAELAELPLEILENE